MKNKKFLKKLTATALGLGLGASSMASAGAISPKSLWENHIQSQSKSNILQKYNKQIQPELYKNLSSHTERYVADFFLDGKIPEFSNSQYLNPYDSAIAEANNILNGKHLDQNDDKAAVFKEYVFQKLLAAQAKITQIKSDVRNKKNDLEKVQAVSLDFLNKYSNNTLIKEKINMINTQKQTCLNLANMILNADASLESVNAWKRHFDLNYTAMQKNAQEALAYINNVINNFNPFSFSNIPNNNFNPFAFANIPNNNFNPFSFSNMPNNNFNPFAFANIPNNNFNASNSDNTFNNTTAPTPMISNQINSINNAQAKKI